MISTNIQAACQILNNNDLVAIPTETVYGLAANALNEKAVLKIFTLKKRPAYNPLIIHIGAIEDLDKWAKNIPEKAYLLAKTFWPGPLTLVLEKKPMVPNIITAGKNTVGIRMPNHPVTLSLLERLGLMLLTLSKEVDSQAIAIKKRVVFKHAFTNGSVLLILGSLCIGFMANAEQAEGIKPFTDDLFKGFLAIFLLDMGISSGKKLKAFFSFGWFPLVFAIVIPLINGCLVAVLSAAVTSDVSNRFIFAILAASASYIAVPAAMKISVPKANPGLYLPMALAVTFPINITVGMPIYFLIIESTF